MGDGCQGLASADDPGAHAPGAGAVVRRLAAGPGLDGSGDGGGAGAGPTHHRPVGVGLRRGRACGPDIRAVRGLPPALDERQREELKAAVPELPEQAGIQLANWYWKGVRQFVWERFGTSLSRSSCLNWLHRLGFAFKRPKKRLLKADEAKRKSFVEEYTALWSEIAPHGRRRAKDEPVACPDRPSQRSHTVQRTPLRSPQPTQHPGTHRLRNIPMPTPLPYPSITSVSTLCTSPTHLPAAPDRGGAKLLYSTSATAELRATRCGFSATRSVCCATPNVTPGDTSRPARNITCCLDDR